jgi:hypothetical protein
VRHLPSYEIPKESWFDPFTATNSSQWRPTLPRLVYSTPQQTAPFPLTDLLREIERSQEMLSWGDDWDDEGSPHFEEATWKRATGFLERHARLLFKRGAVLPTPRILPGPNGSIDLHWETNGRELLINVSPGNTLAGFYGEAAGKTSIKGKVDLDSSDLGLGLFTWLTATD